MTSAGQFSIYLSRGRAQNNNNIPFSGKDDSRWKSNVPLSDFGPRPFKTGDNRLSQRSRRSNEVRGIGNLSEMNHELILEKRKFD